jgi:hypothetical protein
MRVTAFLAAGLIAVATTAPATAVDFSQVDLRPYILFSSHLVIPNIFQPSELIYEEQQKTITQGGATFSSFAAQVEQKIPSAQVYRGIATPAQLSDLKNKLNAANIRGRRTCEFDTLGSQGGSIDITWYSIRGRRNAFRVVSAIEGSVGLPRCPEAVNQILIDLRAFESDILLNPDTEVLLTPH